MKQINTFANAAVEGLPRHLLRYVVDQEYEKYTPIDQAVWRYVMHQNYIFLREIAHYPYIRGLHQAGLNLERIPDLQTINDHLGEIGWGAVTVDGFIPPSAFMEFQAHRVLVIAADIRRLEHIEYTPAPDIIHESAGHAPIIAEPEYHAYLSYFGSVGAKAMFSARDFELYEAIREVSILKELPPSEALAEAEANLERIAADMGEPSEMALLSRLHWWTVEYGLIGDVEQPKIYGAGLLSSIGESSSCMREEVRKLPYSIAAVNYAYDITKPQPQLFVTPDFQTLLEVLEEFADGMAFRRGGAFGLEKALACGQVCTAVLENGLSISGKFERFDGDVHFIRTAGPTALAFEGVELANQGREVHAHGYSTPLGEYSLLQGNFGINENLEVLYKSGFKVSGLCKSVFEHEGKVLVCTLDACTVWDAEGNVIYEPSWGRFDLVFGHQVVSVFCGAADKDAFEGDVYLSEHKTKKPVYDLSTRKLHDIYGEIRAIREEERDKARCFELFKVLKEHYPEDWLGILEILELVGDKEVRQYLLAQAERYPEYAKVISDGIKLLDQR
jgi:phenylalanine-4-hydroxylase